MRSARKRSLGLIALLAAAASASRLDALPGPANAPGETRAVVEVGRYRLAVEDYRAFLGKRNPITDREVIALR